MTKKYLTYFLLFLSSKFLSSSVHKNKKISCFMETQKIKFTLDQFVLLLIILAFTGTSWAFEQGVAGISFFTVLALKFVSVFFDFFIAVYHKRFHAYIETKNWKSYYLRETIPFFVLFGTAYVFKIAFLKTLGYFIPLFAISWHSIQIAVIGMVIGILSLSWLYQPLIAWVYKRIPVPKPKQKKNSAKSS